MTKALLAVHEGEGLIAAAEVAEVLHSELASLEEVTLSVSLALRVQLLYVNALVLLLCN